MASFSLQIQWRTDLTLRHRKSLKRASPKILSLKFSSPIVRCCKQLNRNNQEKIERAREDRGEAEQELEQEQPVYLLSENGWRVRLLENNESDLMEAAEVQAEVFHEPALIFFDDLFMRFSMKEALDDIICAFKDSAPTEYACLVAESDATDYGRDLVGLVHVTALSDGAILKHLEGADKFLYVDGVSVSKHYRRRKVASTLLRACEVQAFQWGLEWLALEVYEENSAARKLYANAGYREVSTQAIRGGGLEESRVLMVKQCRKH